MTCQTPYTYWFKAEDYMVTIVGQKQMYCQVKVSQQLLKLVFLTLQVFIPFT